MGSLFLFGAGASAHSGECLPEPPPLGRDLFDKLKIRRGVAASVDPSLADVFRRDFEVGMARFREERDQDTLLFLREMADFFTQFVPTEQNYYVTLLKHLAKTKHHTTIATLNYDLLIELSASMVGYRYEYDVSRSFSNSLPVLKLHGSCNFLPNTGNLDIRDCTFTHVRAAFDGPLRKLVTPREASKYCRSERSPLAPAMALYAKGKDVLVSPSHIQEQHVSFKKACERATRIYVIGVAVNPLDTHVWNPLAAGSGSLYYVGPDKAPFLEWADSVQRRKIVHLSASFADALPMIRRQVGW